VLEPLVTASIGDFRLALRPARLPSGRDHAAERRRIAGHEAGHAVVAAVLAVEGAVHRVSILRRSSSLGLTREGGLGDDEAVLTPSELQTRIVTLLAGTAAEELVLGQASTDIEQDLADATDLARDMVARWGMSRALGRPRLLAASHDEFLDGATPLGELSVFTQRELDREVRSMLGEAERQASVLLTGHREILELLAERLFEAETLEGVELLALLKPLTDPSGPRDTTAARSTPRPPVSKVRAQR
ncbi:MAG TPA: hypothetical protein VNE21_07020, partial [Mycobacteriales bacterium]|nr:hypothetical protein [Mycobacteriales bacterium]